MADDESPSAFFPEPRLSLVEDADTPVQCRAFQVRAQPRFCPDH
jgi:hypothetical protein